MNLNKIISANLKKLRTEQNLSIRQLSSLSGVSNVMLSQIEKAESNPTINTLWKIAAALNVPYTRLIDELPLNAAIVRKKDRVKQPEDSKQYDVFNYFSYTSQRNFELFYVELAPNATNHSTAHSHKAQEYIFVISGTLKLSIQNQILTLHEEDAAYFESSSNHSYENPADSTLKFICINYYP